MSKLKEVRELRGGAARNEAGSVKLGADDATTPSLLTFFIQRRLLFDRECCDNTPGLSRPKILHFFTQLPPTPQSNSSSKDVPLLYLRLPLPGCCDRYTYS
jgi:hypothetical protein